MDILTISILTFVVVYYLVYELCVYIFSESIQFIKNEVKYNYNEINKDTEVSRDDLETKIELLRNTILDMNNQITTQNVVLQALQNQLNT